MLCEKCGKNHATTHIKTVVNGVIREYNLCDSCAANSGYATNSLTGMLASMFGDFTKQESLIPQTKCSVCGATFRDIAKSGKVGCGECYNTFYDELLPYLKRVHGSTKHVGKVPCSAPLTVIQKGETIEDLRNELARLVREENYEQAAVVRDKIKEMEAGENE
ncbi:MAG: UvrB/UvrC motif-containing protein [Clostridia bacterium]|nr:UvrB/UvrC motif-containing protein [Clostridia bacterium]